MMKAKVTINKEIIECEFLGVFQFSRPIDESPLMGGHKGGVLAYPVAVVKIEGKLKEVSISQVSYL